MIDTTCPNARKLHYARANFKNDFNVVNIVSQSAALLDYKAPGSFGETGDNRQYTFLMYTNPARKQIDQLKLPAEGENFDVKQFQSDNGLSDASAGVGMVVKLGGTADCGSDQSNSAPTPISTAQASSTDAGLASTAVSSAAEQQSSSAASATQTGDASQLGETASSSSSALDGSQGGNSTSPSTTSARQPSDGVAATSVLQTDASGPSTITSTVVLSSRPGGAGASGSQTASASPVLQTGNVAPGLATGHGVVMVPLLAVAGVILW